MISAVENAANVVVDGSDEAALANCLGGVLRQLDGEEAGVSHGESVVAARAALGSTLRFCGLGAALEREAAAAPDEADELAVLRLREALHHAPEVAYYGR